MKNVVHLVYEVDLGSHVDTHPGNSSHSSIHPLVRDKETQSQVAASAENITVGMFSPKPQSFIV